MGGRAGGGASGGMGKGSRAATTVFKGGWSGSDRDTADIQIYAINKQTEKAINVKTLVEWGNGSAHEKDIWVPKSTVSKVTKTKSGSTMTLSMKKSMAQSIANQNSYKGYAMDFTNSYNVWG